MALAAVVYVIVARFFKPQDILQDEVAAPLP